jgi:pantoate--beta-alanine ligase
VRGAAEAARARGERVGLVPTMGYLHEGHRSLLRAAAECEFVIATIFVNPLQFGPAEDLDRYPRDLDADLAACRDEGAHVVFAPSVEEMFGNGPPATTVHVAGLTERMCGAHRPGHFDGVTTVVAKLFAIVGPCRAYFGRKDAQQLAVVTRMARDLDFPVEVFGCPLVREDDGLALSSRNAYLTTAERVVAPTLYRALEAARESVATGTRDASAAVALVRALIDAEPRFAIDYIECVDPDTLEPVARLDRPALLALAARLGATRLIDNVMLAPNSPSASP